MGVNQNPPPLNLNLAGQTNASTAANVTGLGNSTNSNSGGTGAGLNLAAQSTSANPATSTNPGVAVSTNLNPPPPGGAGAGGNLGSSTTSAAQSSSLSVDPTNPAAATQTFAAFLNDAWMADPNLNINALVQAVLRNSYQDNQQDLKDYALKVEFYNNLKKNIRSEIARARSYQSGNASTNGNANFPNGPFQAQPTGSDGYNGSAQVNTNEGNNWGSSGASPGNGMSQTGTINNANDLNSYISTMEDYLTSVGDDAQLAQVNLQNMSQNQQQTLQTLSNLSKSFNDVSMAIIRNIQG